MSYYRPPTLELERVARVEIHTILVDSRECMNIHVLNADGEYITKIFLHAADHMSWPIYFDSDRS